MGAVGTVGDVAEGERTATERTRWEQERREREGRRIFGIPVRNRREAGEKWKGVGWEDAAVSDVATAAENEERASRSGQTHELHFKISCCPAAFQYAFIQEINRTFSLLRLASALSLNLPPSLVESIESGQRAEFQGFCR